MLENINILKKEILGYKDELEEILIQNEQEETNDNINEIQRLLHSFKGLLSFLGESTADLVEKIHSLENQINKKEGPLGSNQALLQTLFDLVDGIGKLGVIIDDDVDKKIVRDQFIEGFFGSNISVKLEQEFLITLHFPKNMGMKSTRAMAIYNLVKRYSTIISSKPSLDELLDDFEDFEQIEFQVQSKENKDELKKYCSGFPHVNAYEVTELTDKSTQRPTELKRGLNYNYSIDSNELLKVGNILEEFLRIDKIIHKLDFHQLPKYERRLLNSFKRKVLDIQETVNITKQIPISAALNPLNRIIRDLSKQYNKKVQFFVSGEHLLVDRKIVEKLTDPIIILLKNAFVHGIESPEDRIQKGKSAEGIIRIQVQQDGPLTKLTIFDNGQGINFDKVWSKAQENNLVSGEFNRAKAIQLLFSPRFTTLDEADHNAGRGIGLSTVKQFVYDVDGTINVETIADKQTSFILTFPTENVISSVILVTINNQMYGFPENHIQKIIRVQPGSLNEIGNELAFPYNVEDKNIATINLPEYFTGNNSRSDTEARETGSILIWNNGLEEYGFFVDNIVTFEEMAVNLNDPVTEISPLFAGTASLGTGEIVFLLQPQAFVSEL